MLIAIKISDQLWSYKRHMLPGITMFEDIITTNQKYKTFFQGVDMRSKGGGALGWGKGSLPECNIDSNRVHFAGPIGN